MTELVFHTPESGDWLVIQDTKTGNTVYEGHPNYSIVYAVLDYLGVRYRCKEYSDEEFQEKF